MLEEAKLVRTEGLSVRATFRPAWSISRGDSRERPLLSTSSLSSVAGGRRTGNEGPTEEGRSGGAKWWWLREISCFLALIPAYVTIPHARASKALFRLRLKASIWPSLSSSPHDPTNLLPDSCLPQPAACRTHYGVARRRGRKFRPAGEGVALAACLIKTPGSRARVTGSRGCDGQRNLPCNEPRARSKACSCRPTCPSNPKTMPPPLRSASILSPSAS